MASLSSTLTKMSVSADNSAGGNTGLLMPKLQFRFRGSFDSFGVSTPTTELTKQIISFARPQVGMEPIALPVYNSMAYIAGRPTWQTASVVLRDDAGGNVSRLVGEQLQKQFDFLEQASASAGIDYKFTARIEMLDGGNGAIEPTVLETWELYGCFLSDVNWGEANYGNNEPMTITMSIRMDNALQTTGLGGVGNPVPRGTGTAVTG